MIGRLLALSASYLFLSRQSQSGGQPATDTGRRSGRMGSLPDCHWLAFRTAAGVPGSILFLYTLTRTVMQYGGKMG